MSRVHCKMTTWRVVCFLLAVLFVLPALAQDQSGTSQSSTSPTSTSNEQTSSSTTTKKKKKAKNKTAAPTTGNTGETNPPSSSSPGSSTAKKSSTSSAGATTDSEIAAAKASGKVWVNLDSGIYHKGGRWYGKTKDGKFMTEQEAKAAGYKPAKRQ